MPCLYVFILASGQLKIDYKVNFEHCQCIRSFKRAQRVIREECCFLKCLLSYVQTDNESQLENNGSSLGQNMYLLSLHLRITLKNPSIMKPITPQICLQHQCVYYIGTKQCACCQDWGCNLSLVYPYVLLYHGFYIYCTCKIAWTWCHVHHNKCIVSVSLFRQGRGTNYLL